MLSHEAFVLLLYWLTNSLLKLNIRLINIQHNQVIHCHLHITQQLSTPLKHQAVLMLHKYTLIVLRRLHHQPLFIGVLTLSKGCNIT